MLTVYLRMPLIWVAAFISHFSFLSLPPQPIPGNATVEGICGVILDVAGLAYRWDKPLSVRLFPLIGMGEGDFTVFESEYLCNCRIFYV